MSDNKKNDGLITSEDHSLRLRSASLVRRGLDQIAKAYEQRKANGLSAYEAFLRKGKEGIREHLDQMELRKQQGRDDSSSSASLDSSKSSGKNAALQYNLGKSYVRDGQVFEAFRAFETALAAQKDSGLYGYALGLVAALLGDDLAVFDQEEALTAKGLTPLSDDLFQFLNKHSNHIAEFAEDEEFKTLMCQLVESKIHSAELLTGMAQEFDRVAAGSDPVKNSDTTRKGT